MRKLSLKQWLAVYGKESCNGCHYNIPTKAKCTYRKGYCARYDAYLEEFKPKIDEPTLFE